MHMVVNAYLWPLEHGGWNSPIKPIEMNSIGVFGYINMSLNMLYHLDISILTYPTLFHIFEHLGFHTFPKYSLLIYLLAKPLCPSSSWASLRTASL